VYLTDGVFLYRVVGPSPDAAGERVVVEDCFLPDAVSVSIAELRTSGLRAVTPAGFERSGEEEAGWVWSLQTPTRAARCAAHAES
jgi:hypothetical protein